MRQLYTVLYIIALLLMPAVMPAQEISEEVEKPEKPEVKFTFGGYVKLDLILTRFSGGIPDITSPVRDMYLPAAIPVGGEKAGYDTQIHAKESRFNFDVSSTLLNKPIRGFVELDFLLSKAGDQRVSNSYNPRLRHFFFTWGNWTFGQTWTTFMTVEAIPDGVVFLPGGEGLVFNRQGQIRYAHKGWSFSIENPETTFTPYQEGSRYVETSGGMPDVVIKHTFSGKYGLISLAGMYRFLLYEDENANRSNGSGFGINASGVVKTGARNDIRFMATYGQGMGRYIGFAFTTAAILDQSSELHPVQSTSGVVSFTHHWNARWRTSVHAAFFVANDNTEFTSGNANRSVISGSISMLYTPHPKLLFGLQFLGARRELENGVTGDMGRIQFSAKYLLHAEIGKK